MSGRRGPRRTGEEGSVKRASSSIGGRHQMVELQCSRQIAQLRRAPQHFQSRGGPSRQEAGVTLVEVLGGRGGGLFPDPTSCPGTTVRSCVAWRRSDMNNFPNKACGHSMVYSSARPQRNRHREGSGSRGECGPLQHGVRSSHTSSSQKIHTAMYTQFAMYSRFPPSSATATSLYSGVVPSKTEKPRNVVNWTPTDPLSTA